MSRRLIHRMTMFTVTLCCIIGLGGCSNSYKNLSKNISFEPPQFDPPLHNPSMFGRPQVHPDKFDIPVHKGAGMIVGTTDHKDIPEKASVDAILYSGAYSLSSRVTNQDVTDFYIRSLPPNGWILTKPVHTFSDETNGNTFAVARFNHPVKKQSLEVSTVKSGRDQTVILILSSDSK
jgi:hypothetical protein